MDPIPHYIAAAKLALSLLLGAAVGLNREYKRKPAGIRTHVLISVGATLFMLVSVHVPNMLGGENGDLTRIAAQVVSGVGFLGAGVIMRQGLNVKGLNTAASIWIVAAIGLSVGAGMYVISVLTTLAALFTLIILDWVEKRFFSGDRQKLLLLSLKSARFDIDDLNAILAAHGIETSDVDLVRSLQKKETHVRMLIGLPRDVRIETLTRELGKLKDVVKIGFENREF
jgi:putative Mg2+ transporter-C (MgtC) family protein